MRATKANDGTNEYLLDTLKSCRIVTITSFVCEASNSYQLHSMR